MTAGRFPRCECWVPRQFEPDASGIQGVIGGKASELKMVLRPDIDPIVPGKIPRVDQLARTIDI